MSKPFSPRQPDLHHVKVTIPDGQAIFAKVEIDGQEVRGLTFVKVEAGIPENYDVQVTLRMYAHVEYEGDAAIVFVTNPAELGERRTAMTEQEVPAEEPATPEVPAEEPAEIPAEPEPEEEQEGEASAS